MTRKRIDLTGQVFGRLTALSPICITPSGWLWLCQCSCGKRHSVKLHALRSGNTKSCGCLKSEMLREKNYRHGLLIRGEQSAEFYAFINAKKRCTDPDNQSFDNYGGRGIEFRFSDFDEFLAEIGPRPSPQHSLDRINNDGHYESGNVRWATNSEQATNRRQNSRKGHHGFMTKEEMLHSGLR